jgi:dTDP-glucose 4,6-dehydratase
MKLLITGGAGFIGSNYIRYAHKAHPDYFFINLDKLTYAGNLENLRDLEASERYTFLKGDICDKKVLDKVEFDVIINFAAESHVDRSILDAQPFLKTNVIGTFNLLEISRERECMFLHISTDEVYGSIKKGSFHENSPLLPNSPYAASKASSDMLIRSYVETHRVKAIITRCSNNYGPYQFPEKLFPLIILNAMNKKPIPIYGDGLNVRDWIYVEDHCKAIDRVLHKGSVGEIYNIGARNEKTNRESVTFIVKTIADLLNLDKNEGMNLMTYVKDREGHDRRYAIDPTKIERELNWKPEMSFEEGITKTIEWYAANKKWWERIISGQYKEYYRTQYDKRFQT